MCLFKRFISFNDKNLGSVGQRSAKLPAIKHENDLIPCVLERGLISLSVARAGRQTFS